MKKRDTEKYSVYKLVDANDVIHYVGISTHPYQRYGEHLSQIGFTAKDAWMQESIGMDILPRLVIIETVIGRRRAEIREAFWIGFYLGQGHPLKNTREVQDHKGKTLLPHASMLEMRKETIGISLKYFVEDQCVLGKNAFVFNSDFFERYEAYCESKGYIPIDRQQVTGLLSKLYKIMRKRSRNPSKGNSVERGIVGIALREQSQEVAV